MQRLTSKIPLTGSQNKGNEHASNEQEQKRRENEYRRVKQELATHKPLSRRDLSIITGIEIGNLCRCLFELVNDYKSVKIAFTAKCQYTGKRVYHYTLASKLDKQEGGEHVSI
jgi:hypothetical protein